ncbi:MAG: serine protease [Thermoanaerobaculia bacterium]|jgi:hypothetical protein
MDTMGWLRTVFPLVVGMYPWVPDEHQEIRDAGSGVLVAPGIALTAAHVTRSFLRMDSRVDPSRRRKGTFVPQYTTMLYRPSEISPIATVVNWAVDVDWSRTHTDIDILQIVPVNDAAQQAAPDLVYLPWRLLPPPVGGQVRLYGYPLPGIVNDGHDHHLRMQLVGEIATVDEICEPMRDHGMFSFPTYRLNRRLDHGFSGGPVFFDGALVGIFSGGPDYEDVSYVASLWPLALATFHERSGAEHCVTELVNGGVISVIDWDAARESIQLRECEDALKGSTVAGRCADRHVVRHAAPLAV